MKNCATYDANGCAITDMEKINFIYGANGSGKSTISNYLQDPQNPQYVNCVCNRNENTSEIIVYNKRFREENLGENIEGVFSLGKATKEQINEVEGLKNRRNKLIKENKDSNETLSKSSEELRQLEEDYKKGVWDEILKNNESDFGECFSGFRNSKKAFFNEFKKRLGKKKDYSGTYNALKERANVIFSSTLSKCDMFNVDDNSIIEKIELISENQIWEKVIVGNKDVPLAKMINELQNEDWVRKGKSFIKNGGRCPFCQQNTIDDKFIHDLELYFDSTYEEDIDTVKELLSEYESLTNTLIEALSSHLEEYEKINVGKLDIDRYRLSLDSIKQAIKTNITTIRDKQAGPSRKVSLSPFKEEYGVLVQMLNEANKRIEKNNTMVSNFSNEKEILIDDVWNFFLSNQETLINRYEKMVDSKNKEVNGIKATINKKESDITNLENEIVKKEKDITSVQPAVNEINRSLKAYGFNSFKIVSSPVKENCYQIQREDGSLANNSLSEGEETFISFLYFMQHVKGSNDKEKISSKRIIILDDPICSLDSTILYVVSAMVKELAKDVKSGKSDVEQLIILTHNVFFHKETSFFSGRQSEDKDMKFWMLYKDNNLTSIRPYDSKNPISTSYALLWRELKDNSSSSIVTIQNTMRRILENYFGLLGNRRDDLIIDRFDTLEEKIICRALFNWINDGSHSINDDLFIDSYTDSIEKYKKVFKQIFEKTNNLAHYNMMMQIDDTEQS